MANGVADKDDLDTIKEAVANNEKPDSGLLLGTVGAYSVAALSTIAEYVAPQTYSGMNILIG